LTALRGIHDFRLLGLSYNIHFSSQVIICVKKILFLESEKARKEQHRGVCFCFRERAYEGPIDIPCESFPAILGDRKCLAVLLQAHLQVPVGFGKNSRLSSKCSPHLPLFFG